MGFGPTHQNVSSCNNTANNHTYNSRSSDHNFKMVSLLFTLVSTALLTLTAIVPEVASENILFLIPIGTKSHYNIYEPLIQALAVRGHNLTIVAPIKYSERNTLENATVLNEIVPIPFDQMFPAVPNVIEIRQKVGHWFPAAFKSNPTHWPFIYNLCHEVFQKPEFLSILNATKFELVFTSAWFSCFDGMLPKLGAPFIKLVTMAPPGYLTQQLGNFMPSAVVPSVLARTTQTMDFWNRFRNFIVRFIEDVISYKIDQRKCEAIYRKYLGEDLPSVDEISKNTSLVMCNSHYAINYARPLLPQVVQVGGMHCRAPKAIPEDLESFVSGGDEGFILFSLGTVVRTDELPESTRKAFIKAFSTLKHKVLWKWSAPMDDLPPNVKAVPWLPQQDLLGHPKIKAFITHGGLLSIQETVYHGVPMLGIPVFGDQDNNVDQTVEAGYGLKLEITDFTADELQGLLRRLIEEPGFSQKARQMSAVIKDSLHTPTEEAVYWSEFVMRHDGAKFMRSAARNLNFVEYYSLDVICALVLLVFGGIAVFVTLMILVCKFVKAACSRNRVKLD